MLAMSLPVMHTPPLAFTRASKAWAQGTERAAGQARFVDLVRKPTIGSAVGFQAGTHTRTRVTDTGVLEMAPQVAADENFLSTAVGAAPSGWTLTQPGSSTTLVQQTAGMGKALKITDATNAEVPAAVKSFAMIAKGSVEFKLKAEQTTAYLGITLSDGSKSFTLYVYGDGSFKYIRFDAAGAYLGDTVLPTATSYVANTVYDIRLEWDFSAGANSGISVYVNGALKGANLNNVVTSYMANVASVQFSGNSGSTGNFWIGNFKALSRLGLSFNRTSAANNPFDGSQKATHLPRFTRGKNLLDKNQSDIETNTSGFQFWNTGTAMTRDTAEFWQGSASLRLNCDGTVGGQGVYATAPFSAPYLPGLVPFGTTITGSVYIKGAGNLYVQAIVLYTDGTTASSAATSVAATSSWVRHSASITTSATKTVQRVRIAVYTQAAQAAIYWIDGLQVEIAPAATAWAQGGDHAVMAEEGTTNLLTAGAENFVTSWTDFSGATKTVTAGQTDPFGGANAYRVVTSGGTAATKVFASGGTAGAGLKYSVQCWMKNNDATNAVTIGNNMGGSTTLAAGAGWTLVKLENATGGGVGTALLRFDSVAAGTNLDISVMWPQIEQKAYCTSYVAPGSSRSQELGLIPAYPEATAAAGTVVVRAYCAGEIVSAAPAAQHGLFRFEGAGNTNTIRIFKNTINGGAILARISNGAGATTDVSWNTPGLTAGWHTFLLRWSGSRVSLYVDGQEKAFVTTGINLPAAAPTLLNVGSDGSGSGQFWNNPIDFLQIYTTAVSDADAVILSSTGTPSATPAFEMDFAGTLDFGGTAEWLSDWNTTHGASNVNVAYTGWDDWARSTPTGTTATLKFSTAMLDSKADASAFSNNLTIQTGRFIRHKIEWTKSSLVSAFPTHSYVIPAVTSQGKALLLEEATTNLFAASIEDMLTGWNNSSGSVSLRTTGMPDPFGGTNAYRIQATSGTTTTKYTATAVNPSLNATAYSVSVWVRVLNDFPVTVSSNIAGGPTQTVSKTDGWTYVRLENITGNGTQALQIRFAGASTDADLDFLAYQPMAEQKGFATSFMPGGQSRVFEALQMPTFVVGSGAGKVKANALLLAAQNAVNGQALFNVNGTTVPYALVYYSIANAYWRYEMQTANGSRLINGITVMNRNEWHSTEWTWTATDMAVKVDNVQTASASTNVGAAHVPTGTAWIGCRAGTIWNLNGLIKDFEVDTGAGGQLFRVDFSNGGFDYKRVAA